MAAGAEVTMSPAAAFALVGAIGVGSQWLAWWLNMPVVVLMLVAGLCVGPVFGLLEGSITLNSRTLTDAALGVRRLPLIGAPLG